MAKTSTERYMEYKERMEALGRKAWKTPPMTNEERKIIKPMVERKLKQLRKE